MFQLHCLLICCIAPVMKYFWLGEEIQAAGCATYESCLSVFFRVVIRSMVYLLGFYTVTEDVRFEKSKSLTN